MNHFKMKDNICIIENTQLVKDLQETFAKHGLHIDDVIMITENEPTSINRIDNLPILTHKFCIHTNLYSVSGDSIISLNVKKIANGE